MGLQGGPGLLRQQIKSRALALLFLFDNQVYNLPGAIARERFTFLGL